MLASTIIITEGKRQEMLFRAIKSCLRQSLPLQEIIVVNDGLSPLELPSFEKLKIVSTDGQMGLAAARQKGLDSLGKESEAVSYLDDDDELLPNHSETLVPLLDKAQFAVSKAMFRHFGGMITTDPEPDNVGEKSYYDPNALLAQNIAPVSSYMHRKDASVGWDPSIIRMEDWDFWGRMFIKHGPPAFSSALTNIIHRHSSNISNQSRISYGMACSWRDIVSDRLRHMAAERRNSPNQDDRRKFHIPKVGVVMPIYNSSKHLKEALDSILRQTFQDFEILAVNDGSTDDSRRILSEYESKDKRVRAFDIDHSGVTKALNFGLLVSRSQYVARMDADDVSLPERFEKQVSFLDSRKEVSMVGTCFDSMSEDMKSIKWHNDVEKTHEEIFSALRFKCCIGHPTVMMRRRVMEQLGGYSEENEFLAVEDYELWTRMALTHRLENLPDFLLLHRTHGNQVSNRISVQSVNSSNVRNKFMRACTVSSTQPTNLEPKK